HALPISCQAVPCCEQFQTKSIRKTRAKRLSHRTLRGCRGSNRKCSGVHCRAKNRCTHRIYVASTARCHRSRCIPTVFALGRFEPSTHRFLVGMSFLLPPLPRL